MHSRNFVHRVRVFALGYWPTVLQTAGFSILWSIRGQDLPLLPQSAQDSSSSGCLSRFDSFVPRQKLHIGIGSTRSWVGTQAGKKKQKTEYEKLESQFFGLFVLSGFVKSVQTYCQFKPNEKLKEWKTESTSHRLELNNKWSSSSEIWCVWDPPPLSITSEWVTDPSNHSLRP